MDNQAENQTEETEKIESVSSDKNPPETETQNLKGEENQKKEPSFVHLHISNKAIIPYVLLVIATAFFTTLIITSIFSHHDSKYIRREKD